MEITDNGFGPVFVGIVGVEEPRVLHELCDVGRLPTRSSGHVQDPFILPGGQGHDGQQRGGALQNVVA